MKELSIEEKARRYDEAIEKAKSKIMDDKDHVLYENDVMEIFPELKESEDEKIRKELMQNLKERFGTHGSMGRNLDMPRVLAWFEKQGEQKPAVIIPNFRAGDVIRIKGSNSEYRITEISDGYYRGKGWCLDIIEGDKSGDYELVEQEPAWSEEDERIRIKTIELLETANHPNKMHSNGIPLDFTENINWLKSLRPQSTWKPSDEQIVALEKTLRYFQMLNAFGETIDGLKELEEQLKKLREE